jgi:hypothetical protein
VYNILDWAVFGSRAVAEPFKAVRRAKCSLGMNFTCRNIFKDAP